MSPAVDGTAEKLDSCPPHRALYYFFLICSTISAPPAKLGASSSLGRSGKLGEWKGREGGPRPLGLGEEGPVAGRSCCEERANKRPSGRGRGKDEQAGNVILKCFDSSRAFAPQIAVP